MINCMEGLPTYYNDIDSFYYNFIHNSFSSCILCSTIVMVHYLQRDTFARHVTSISSTRNWSIYLLLSCWSSCFYQKLCVDRFWLIFLLVLNHLDVLQFFSFRGVKTPYHLCVQLWVILQTLARYRPTNVPNASQHFSPHNR